PGVVGDVHGQQRDVGDALVALVLEVVLGQPERLVAELVHGLGELERRVEGLDHPVVRVPAIVGRRPGVPAVLQLDVADVERRESLDHSRLLRAAAGGRALARRYALAGASVRRSTAGSARRAGSTGTRTLMIGRVRRKSRP